MDITARITEEMAGLPNPDGTKVRRGQVEAAVRLLDEGNTIPFVARYRKEATGSLNDEQLRFLGERLSALRNLEERKEQVISAIEEQGRLTDELRARIEEARTLDAELIVSHHPVIFTPLRTVCDDAPDARRVIALLQGNLSAICLHTNLDALEGGVNTALANAVGAEDIEYSPDIGCFCRLPEKMPVAGFLAQIRAALSAPDMRFYDAGRPVEQLALCGGAGGDILYEAARRGFDTILTGEVKHHQWIDGAELGLNIIEGGHFATENVVTPPLAEMLRQGFPEVDVCLSRLQAPLSRGFGF